MLLFPCICGHYPIEALPTSSLGLVLAWIPFARSARPRIGDKCLAIFFVLFASLIFIKNVGDVLWYGHDPWFQ